MARPRMGTLRRTRTAQGIMYGVQFTYRGESYYVHFGGSWEGWDEERAAGEQRFLMAKVNRGEWTPPPRDPAPSVPTRTRRRSRCSRPSGCTGTSSKPAIRTARPGRSATSNGDSRS